MQIQQIRNATLKIRYDSFVFLIDPWLQDKGTGFSAKAVRLEMQGLKCPLNGLPDTSENILADVDCCLVTHLHFDHFSADYLPKEIPIIAQNEYDADELRSMGFQDVRFFESDSVTINNVIIHKTTAVHGENDAAVERMGKACGYVFQAPGEKTLYLAGDTVYCPQVAEVINECKPEVIILNCCGATTPFGRLIMDLADMEQVCRIAPDAKIIASHLDSVNHAHFTSEDVRRFVQEKSLNQILVPDSGETIMA